MKDIIDKDNLFGDEYNAFILCEYPRELELIKKLSRELGIAVLLITHDLSVVAAICRWVAVMYRGQVVEWGTAEQIFRAPKHPYTQKLLQEERP